MPTEHILSLLISERDKLNRAIDALGAPVKRRGRPAKGAGLVTAVPEPPKRRTFTAAQRKQQAARMKAFWAAKRRAAGKTAKVTASATSVRKSMTVAQKKALSVKMKAAWAKRKEA